MVKLLKTVTWLDCRNAVLAFADKEMSTYLEGKPGNFAEFLTSYPWVLQPHLFATFCEKLMDEKFPDVTEKAVAAENETLFICNKKDEAEALEIALIAEPSSNKGSWYYLDDEKKAVVNFSHLYGIVQVRLFCECNQEFSVLHLVDIDGAKRVVPVVFANALVTYQCFADWQKNPVLRDYLPREKGCLLSKKRHRPKDINADEQGHPQKTYHRDNGDSL